MSALSFIDRIYEKLHTRGWGDDYHAAAIGDRLVNMLNNPPPQQLFLVAPEALHNITNERLIHEMLERGFAVIKLPADGTMPQSLR